MRVRKQLVASRKNISAHPNNRRNVTVHDTGNTGRGANAAAHANLQSKPNPRAASWHYQVDDEESVQSFPHSARTFHAGTAQGNRDSISVEICVNSDGDYGMAVRNAAVVVAGILRAEHLPLSAVVQHHHWTRKHCPAGIRTGRGGINWTMFMALVAAELNQPGSTVPVIVAPPGQPNYGRISPEHQAMLADMEHYDGAVFDGTHGPMSVAATKSFQTAYGLRPDGVMGPITIARLTKEHHAMTQRIIDHIDRSTDNLAAHINRRIDELAAFRPTLDAALREFRVPGAADPVGVEVNQIKTKVARRDLRLMLFELEDGSKGVQDVDARTWMIAPDEATLNGFLDVLRFQGFTIEDSPWGNVRNWDYVCGRAGVKVQDVYRLGRQVEWKPEPIEVVTEVEVVVPDGDDTEAEVVLPEQGADDVEPGRKSVEAIEKLLGGPLVVPELPEVRLAA